MLCFNPCKSIRGFCSRFLLAFPQDHLGWRRSPRAWGPSPEQCPPSPECHIQAFLEWGPHHIPDSPLPWLTTFPMKKSLLMPNLKMIPFTEQNRNKFNNPDFPFKVQTFGKGVHYVFNGKNISFYPSGESCWGFLSQHLWDSQSCSHSLGSQSHSGSRVPIPSPTEPWQCQLSLPWSSDTALGKEADDPSISRHLVKHKTPQAALWDFPGAGTKFQMFPVKELVFCFVFSFDSWLHSQFYY